MKQPIYRIEDASMHCSTPWPVAIISNCASETSAMNAWRKNAFPQATVEAKRCKQTSSTGYSIFDIGLLMRTGEVLPITTARITCVATLTITKGVADTGITF